MDATIAAISTAMSASGIGIVRISGENAMDVTSAPSANLPVSRPSRPHNLIVLSELPVAMVCPSGENATGVIDP